MPLKQKQKYQVLIAYCVIFLNQSVLREAIQSLGLLDSEKKQLGESEEETQRKGDEPGDAVAATTTMTNGAIGIPVSIPGQPEGVITVTDRKVFELRGELENVIHRYKARVDELEKRVGELEGINKDLMVRRNYVDFHSYRFIFIHPGRVLWTST